MQEVLKTHLPLLAWRRSHEGPYRLIYDDLSVGELSIDTAGQGLARYHDQRWTIESLSPTRSQILREGSSEPIGRLDLSENSGPEEGTLELNGRTYRCLRDTRKIPPQVTITTAENGPLLQYREEDENQGRIQIDNQKAASSSDFEIIVLWGLYLYVKGSTDTQPESLDATRRSLPGKLKPAVRPFIRKTPTNLEDRSGGNPPMTPIENKRTGGDGEGEGTPNPGLLIAAVGFLALLIFRPWRRFQNR